MDTNNTNTANTTIIRGVTSTNNANIISNTTLDRQNCVVKCESYNMYHEYRVTYNSPVTFINDSNEPLIIINNNVKINILQEIKKLQESYAKLQESYAKLQTEHDETKRLLHELYYMPPGNRGPGYMKSLQSFESAMHDLINGNCDNDDDNDNNVNFDIK